MIVLSAFGASFGGVEQEAYTVIVGFGSEVTVLEPTLGGTDGA